MTEMLIDTQKAVDRLTEAGVPLGQARAHAALLADVIASVDGHVTEHFASRDSVSIAVEKFEASMEKLRSDLMRWGITVAVLQTAIISLIVTLAIALTRT